MFLSTIFSWQTAYRLAEPRIIPRGSKLKTFSAYDNSPNNLANPDPSKTVTWGDQSWDEMHLGYFDVAIPKGSENVAERIISAVGRANDPTEIAKRIFGVLDKNKDGQLARDEVDPAQRPIFDKLDTNQDGIVTEAELIAGLPELRKLFRP